MRQTRRGCFAGRKEPKYVWYVYDLSWALDEASATTGSASLNNSSLRMTSGQYTVDASGFTLVNPLYQKPSQMASKVYVVDISSQGSTDTTGPYLYEVTRTGGWNPTYQYVRYSSAPVRGGTVLWVVESDTMDYPIDGEQGGYWYVMVKGERPMYVWDVFNVIQIQNGYEQVSTPDGTALIPDVGGAPSPWENNYTVVSSNQQYTFDTSTGKYEIVGRSYETSSDSRLNEAVKNARNSYFFTTSTSSTRKTSKLYYNLIDYELGQKWSDYGYYCTVETTLTSQPAYIESRGNATGQTVESTDIVAYPQDGVQGEYWYTYSHSYSYEFDNR